MRTLVVILLLLSSVPAAGAKLKVPKQYATIAAAVAASGAGDVIEVSKGEYGPVVLSGRTNLRLRGKKGAVLKGLTGVDALVLQNCADVRVDGFEIRHLNATSEECVLVDSCAGTVRLENCKLRGGHFSVVAQGNSATLIFRDLDIRDPIGTGVYLLGDGALIEDCRIRDAATGVRLLGRNNTVRDNLIEDSGTVSISLAGGGGAIDANLVQGNRVRRHGPTFPAITVTVDNTDNSLLDNRIEEPFGVGMEVEADDTLIAGNRFTQNTGHALVVIGADAVIQKNKVLGGGDSGIVLDDASSSALVLGNVVKKSQVSGLLVDGAAHQIVGNVVKKSGFLDLHDAGGTDCVWFDNAAGTDNL